MSTDIALFVLRVVAGAVVLTHGWPKLSNFQSTLQWLMKEKFPLPLLSTLALSITETFFAVFLILGILTKVAAVFIGLAMLVATGYHIKKGDTFHHNTEVTLLLLAIMVTILLAGGGSWQIAAWL